MTGLGRRIWRWRRCAPFIFIFALLSTPAIAGSDLCDPGTICVGAGTGFPTLGEALAAAHDGDVIGVAPGIYHESVIIRQNRLTVKGIGGRPHFACEGVRPVQDKACILLAGANIVLDNIEISGAVIPQAVGANAACVRNEPGKDFTLRHVSCHASQNGVLVDGGSILIEDSELFDNGWTGLTHNVYLSGDCMGVTVRNSVFRDARVGHEFKSRCRKTAIFDSRFSSTRGSRALDIPDGGETMITGGSIEKALGTANPELIGFTAESCRYPAPMRLVGVKIKNADPRGAIVNFGKCAGQPITLEKMVISEIPPRLTGDVQQK